MNADTGLTDMLNKIGEADSFVSNFVSGNEISESFYGYININLFLGSCIENNTSI